MLFNLIDSFLDFSNWRKNMQYTQLYAYLTFTVVIAAIIFVSKAVGRKYTTIPIAIWCLITSILVDQFQILEHIHVDSEVSQNLSVFGLAMISSAMFQIGLEVTDFKLLGKSKFWLFIGLIVLAPGGIYFLSMGNSNALQCIAYGLLLFTSSLAVVAVFVQRQPELFHNRLIKSVMVIGVTTDILLWVGIGILNALHHEGSSVIDGILPQMVAILGSIFIIALGKIWWWNKALSVRPIIWFVLGGIIAFGFHKTGLSPVLGAIFGGLMVPERMKHRVSKNLTPIFTWSMLVYMSTVGFKVHELLSPEALEIAVGFIVITTVGKSLAIVCGNSLFFKGRFIQVVALLGNPGTMGIAAAATLSHEGLVSQAVFEGMVIVAIIYTVLAGIVLKKNPIQIEEESDTGLIVLKPAFGYSE